ncbi:MAG: ATP-binding protein, partial [Clostridia bacterium]|nr:ATP-binding protein [Clostridia bacterium]
MNGLEELARQAHNQIRELILQIRLVTIEKEGLGAALKDYLKNVAEREDWSVKDHIELSVRPGDQVGENLFRMAQEALNNISKHAAAKNVEVKLIQDKDNIRLSISDDGVGFDLNSPIKPTALGLSGIHERAAAIGGRVVVNSSPGRGTELTVLVSLKSEGSVYK